MSLDDAAQRAAVARAVAARRVKRRLKAAASIGLAIMAGAFLACASNKGDKEKARAPVPPNPMTPSVGAVPPASAHADSDAGPQTGAAQVVPAASTTTTAIVPAPKTPHKAPTVDKQEHRKGMPVPDNLLE